MDIPLQSIDQVRVTAIDLAFKFGPKLLVAVLILVAGYLVGRWAGGVTTRAIARLRLEPPVRVLIERIVRVLVLGLFFILALQNLGVELLPLIAGLGVAGAGVALAMQGVLGNMVAGLTIILAQPFRVGDYISIVKEEGDVLDISLFNTTLGHPDLSKVVIPNRKIVGEVLHNYGRIRQLALEVGVAYDTDLAAAVSALHAVLGANSRVLPEPAPLIFVARLAESIRIGVSPWVDVADYFAAGGELNRAILEAFRDRRIVIPMPQREVHLVGKTA
ncbi:MAG: mechanosensitive ion channel family protein [Betaproteobacteria bacterium]|nr:MAG: mechanosensitive ion channel family protein [Betaproteobacteria bacterium]